jgi:hypothetical protein
MLFPQAAKTTIELEFTNNAQLVGKEVRSLVGPNQ